MTTVMDAVAPPEAVAARLAAAAHLLLLLDYDGTLVPFAALPELASPDAGLLDLLRVLAVRPATDVHVVSGRGRESLERWLGALPIGLHAEHGFWSRPAGASEWTSNAAAWTPWREDVRALLQQFTAQTPGSLVEEKAASLAWHWRLAEPARGAAQARALRERLDDILRGTAADVLLGEKVIEVRPAGVSKRYIVDVLTAAAPPGTLVAAFGDDLTDEELFAALPPGSLAIHVGPLPTRAPIQLADPSAVRRLLATLVA